MPIFTSDFPRPLESDLTGLSYEEAREIVYTRLQWANKKLIGIDRPMTGKINARINYGSLMMLAYELDRHGKEGRVNDDNDRAEHSAGIAR